MTINVFNPKSRWCTVALLTLCCSVFGQYSKYPRHHPPQCHPNKAFVDSRWKGKLPKRPRLLFMPPDVCIFFSFPSYCCVIFTVFSCVNSTWFLVNLFSCSVVRLLQKPAFNARGSAPVRCQCARKRRQIVYRQFIKILASIHFTLQGSSVSRLSNVDIKI